MTANPTPANDNVVKVLLDDGNDDDDDETENVSHNDETAEEIVVMKTTMSDRNDEMNLAVLGKGKSEGGEERLSWSKKREYILTILGYIVGIGNLWRFPYMCNRNGGGAFLLPFLLCLTIVGFPLFFLETALGQFTAKSPLHVWSICPLVRGAGISMCIMSGVVVWYYNTIMTWALYYLVSSFKSQVPWSLCGQWWNTPQCTVVLTPGQNATSANGTSGWDVTSSEWRNSTPTGLTEPGNDTEHLKQKVVTAAEEFWQNNVLQISDGFHQPGRLVWYLAVMQCVVFLVLFLSLVKGVKSSGKVVYVTAIAPYVILLILLVRGATLPGAVDGILFYITPDFQRLLDPVVWIEAALQVFYSLGPAWGGLITVASYNRFNNNCLRDAFLISFVGEGTSVFGGFAIFSVLGYMAKQTGVPIQEVVSGGPGLAFIVYPEAISLLPLPQLWAILFFFMITTLVIDSQMLGMEAILTVICDTFPRTLGKRRVLVTASFCLVFLLASLIFVCQGGIYMFQLCDWFVATLTVTTVGFVECIVVGWVYGADRFGEDIRLMLGRKPPVIINILWCFVNPLLLAILLVTTLLKYQAPTYGDYHYDSVAIALGWGVALISFLPMACHGRLPADESQGFSDTGQWLHWANFCLMRLKQTTTPDKHWGPSDPAARLLYAKHLQQRVPRRRCLDVLR